MYIKNSIGPNTVPCGTPDVTGMLSEEWFSSITVYGRFD